MIAKNVWFRRRVQIIYVVVWVYLIYLALRSFRKYSSLPIRRGEKFFYCVIVDRIIAVLIFLIKLTLSYDPHSYEPFKSGSFNHKINEVILYVWLSAIPSVWGVLFIFSTTKFVYQIILICGSMVLQMWLYYYYELTQTRVQEKQQHMKRVLCGLNEPLNDHEVLTLTNMGYRITGEKIGFGTFGTSYKCGFLSRPNIDLVLKVIDITEWVHNRNPTTLQMDIHFNMHQEITHIRNRYLEVVHKLRGLDNPNIVKFERLHNEGGAFNRIYIMTQLADMSLDTFLSQYKPDGVQEGWAREWFTQLCRGLYYLHEIADTDPFIHSNIKPENILIYPKKKSNPEPYRFRFGSTDDHMTDSSKASHPKQVNLEMRDRFVLKLSDCGFSTFLPLGGKVVTKRDPPIMISPPKKVLGKKQLRVLTENQRKDEKKFDDIYQMGVILVLLLKGDIRRLIKEPIDTERIHNQVTGVDAFYVRFDKPEHIRKLFGNKSPELNRLLRKMMEWEPLLRYDIKQVLGSDWMKVSATDQMLFD